MELEEIQLGPHTKIYRCRYENYPKDKIIYAVNQNAGLFGQVKPGYGGQSMILMEHPEFTKIKNFAVDKCRTLCNIDESTWDGSYVTSLWVFHISETLKNYYKYVNEVMSTKKYYSGVRDSFHAHPYILYEHQHVKTQWSFCFYLQVPTDLVGEEGKFLIVDEDNNIFSMEVNEGDVIFFQPSVWHRPHPIPNSKQERISICGNITFDTPNLHKTKLL